MVTLFPKTDEFKRQIYVIGYDSMILILLHARQCCRDVVNASLCYVKLRLMGHVLPIHVIVVQKY